MHQGERIKQLMEKKGMTAYDLAPLLGKTPPAIYKMVKNMIINKVVYEAVIKEIENWDVNKVGNQVNELSAPYGKRKEENQNDPNMDAKEKEIEMLRELLKSKEEIIKSKDETIEALRGQSRSDYKGKSRQA